MLRQHVAPDRYIQEKAVVQDIPALILQLSKLPKPQASTLQPGSEVVLVGKSTAKANQPSVFHGTEKDYGKPASNWAYSFRSYMEASRETNPMPFVATYLSAEALNWWRSIGQYALTANATLA